MEKYTALEWFYEEIIIKSNINYYDLFEQAKAMERQQIKDAVMYGLDEDGHTGDWKISVSENYYKKTYENNK